MGRLKMMELKGVNRLASWLQGVRDLVSSSVCEDVGFFHGWKFDNLLLNSLQEDDSKPLSVHIIRSPVNEFSIKRAV